MMSPAGSARRWCRGGVRQACHAPHGRMCSHAEDQLLGPAHLLPAKVVHTHHQHPDCQRYALLYAWASCSCIDRELPACMVLQQLHFVRHLDGRTGSLLL